MSTTTTLNQADAAAGRLPPNLTRVFISLRDFTLVDISLPGLPLVQRVGVTYDFDRDIRALQVLSTFVLTNRSLCADLVGLAESKGVLRSYWAQPQSYAGGFHSANHTDRLQLATNVTLEGEDHWVCAPAQFVLLDSHAQLNVSTLPEDHPLRLIPSRFQLGRVPQ